MLDKHVNMPLRDKLCLLVTLLIMSVPSFARRLDNTSEDALSVEWTHINVRYGDRPLLAVPPGALPAGRLVGVLGPSGNPNPNPNRTRTPYPEP